MLKISSLIGLLIVSGSIVFGWFWMDYQSALSLPLNDKTLYIEVKRGDSFNQISQNLISQGVNIKPMWFKIYAYRNQLATRLKAGDYEIAKGSTLAEITSVLVSGRSRQYPITFPEGWNYKQVFNEIRNTPNIKLNILNSGNEAILKALKSEYEHPEGLFFPDTYYFEKHTSDLDLLKRAYRRMKNIVADEWEKREKDLPLKTPYEALILASIIEKETGVEYERPMIAGVFIRRLKKGMLLQTDPTVIYGMGDEYDGNIRRKDLTKATPYNTYVIQGLPPTPIAMPGQEAIHAALHPAAGKSLYFVARGDGSHEFSDTIRQHNRAVAKFQLKRKR